MTLVTSWLSLAFTLSAFTRARRNSTDRRCCAPDKVTVIRRAANNRHQAFETLWRLAETGGRVLAIALFTSVFRVYLLAFLVPHGLILATWMFLQVGTHLRVRNKQALRSVPKAYTARLSSTGAA